MPSLYSLRTDFSKLSPQDQLLFIRQYRKKRSEDLLKPSTFGESAAKEKSSTNKMKEIGLTPEEISIAKALGLSPKDLKALKEVAARREQ